MSGLGADDQDLGSPMTSHLWRRTAHLAAALLLGSALPGCGDDAAQEPDAEPTASTSGNAEIEPTEPSESPESSVLAHLTNEALRFSNQLADLWCLDQIPKVVMVCQQIAHAA